MKYKLTAPKYIKPTKTALLVSVAVLIIAATFAYGAVRKAQLDRSEAAATAAQVQAEKAQHDAATKATAAVQSDLNIQRNKALAACSVLKQYSTARATAKLISYPPVCNL